MSYTVTLIPGDGIGPEVTSAAIKVLEATGVKFVWEPVKAGQEVLEEYGTPLPQYVLDSVKKNKVAFKGPLTTPIGTGFRSANVALRKELDLFANVRPSVTFPGVKSRYENVDLIVVRENTEDLYAGVEHMVGKDAAESIKIITRAASERIARHAFTLAKNQGRKKVTCVHKANIMKLSDGLFLESCRKVAAEFPEIKFEDMIVDAMCMRLVQQPEKYDVLVMANLYGDIVSDLCAGLVGGLGVAPGGNFGENGAVFEPVHGSAPDIAGQGKANPLAQILTGVMMLRHLGELEAADRVQQAVNKVLAEGKVVTPDLGGSATTDEMAQEVINNL